MSRLVPLGRLLPIALLSSLALLGPSPAETTTGKKYALLVGVRSYDHDSLPDLKHTENDVEEVGKVLIRSGYRVKLLTSTRGKKAETDRPTAKNIRAALKAILDGVTKHDTVLVALAGHGIQLRVKVAGGEKEEGYFCPADAKPRDTKDAAELGKTMIPLTALFAELEDSGAGVKLLLVDACRNDPKAGRNVDVDSLPRPPRGTAALFSCKSGERAFETDKLGKGHGVFFFHVLQGLEGKAKNDKGEITWTRLTEYVIDKVSDEVPVLIGGGAKQTPHEIRNLTGKSPILVGPGKEGVVKEGAKEITNSIGMKLVRIKPGTFTMGSPKSEGGSDDEGPQHEVTITKAFYMGVYTVTQEEYEQVMGSNPSYFSSSGGGKDKVAGMSTKKFPVEQVSWEDAVKFCDKLSALRREKTAGRTYRLPTEAEWEYACRAGTTTKYHSGNDEDDLKKVGWYSENSGSRTHEVGEKKANAWGLYDMHGNVWQWCNDRYGSDYYKEDDKRDPENPKSGTSHVLRGGSWSYFARLCRAAYRNFYRPESRFGSIGFRVVCGAAGTR